MGKWIQVQDANINIPYVGGWCWGYVSGAWGRATLPTVNNQITSATPNSMHLGSAIEAWNANCGGGNHPGELPPVGKTVAVFFSLGNVWQGHVAISLDDGGIASSSMPGYHDGPYFYHNLDAMIADYAKYNGGCTYLGWCEFTDNVRAVEYQPDVTTNETTTSAIIPFQKITRDDNTLPLGKTRISVAGVDGKTTVITKIYYSDGVETGREPVQTTIPPVDEITLVGTFVAPVIDDKPTIEQPVVTRPVKAKPTLWELINKLVQLITDLIKRLKGTK